MNNQQTQSSDFHEVLISWRESKSKKSILDFVKRVTERDSPEYIPSEDRIAVFDNDGTLWCEKPLPIQADFLFRRLAEMVREDPTLKDKQPWKAVVDKDYAWLGGVIEKHYKGDDSDLKLMGAGLLEAFEGSTIEDYECNAKSFLESANHPKLKRSYLECAFLPMVELLHFLEEHGFQNFIATGGGRDFMRPITESLYGIPPERIIGSSVSLVYLDEGEYADILHRPELDLFDDGQAKPVSIWSRVGKRPILAVGNSNGDIPMLHFCAHPHRPSLSLLVDHDDETREFSYKSGAEKSLEMAGKLGWQVISMRRDWKTVFASSPDNKVDHA